MTTSTGGFSSLLAPGLFEVMFNEIDMQPNQWLAIMNVLTSKRAYEEDLKIAGLGIMQPKPEGVNTIFDDPIQGSSVRYTHSSFGLGFRVTREMWDDDLYMIINQMPAELGRAAAYKIEIDAWSVLNNAFSSSFVGQDSLALCHTAHTRLDGGATQGNRPSTDTDFSYTAYQAALEHYNQLVDDRGRPQVLNPALLIVSPTFEWAAKEVLGSEYKPYTANNEINPLNDAGVSYMRSRYLLDADSWFLVAPPRKKRSSQGHDLKFWWRTRPEEASSDDFMSGDALFKIFTRYSKGFSEWRGVYGSSGG